jgi:hypothetical protein
MTDYTNGSWFIQKRNTYQAFNSLSVAATYMIGSSHVTGTLPVLHESCSLILYLYRQHSA